MELHHLQVGQGRTRAEGKRDGVGRGHGVPRPPVFVSEGAVLPRVAVARLGAALAVLAPLSRPRSAVAQRSAGDPGLDRCQIEGRRGGAVGRHGAHFHHVTTTPPGTSHPAALKLVPPAVNERPQVKHGSPPGRSARLVTSPQPIASA